ncbi:MAG: bifunctional riboflavin kinase/FAD synthetase [Pseudomonadota bacterium]|nr:bifunctional riboflavin kinase/FAD synthetase [Pseudomonadota bacterium]
MNRLFRDVECGPGNPHGSVVCIGAFDGLHLGHQALVRHAVARARALSAPGAPVESVVLSFEPLPREYFAGGSPPPRLLLPRAKIEGLFALGADRIGLLRFDAALSALGPEEFVLRVLVGRLGAREVWVGPGFRFGKGRSGDLSVLQKLGAQLQGSGRGFAAGEIEPVLLDGEPVSSTRVRAALQAGDFSQAERLLGRPYAIGGRVVLGRQLGRTLGIPTANIRLAGKKPALSGIYAARVHGVGTAPHPAVASLGTRPTVDGVEPLLEAHLLDFDGDLYGCRLQVEFVAKLRDEVRFPDLASLTEQMHRDAEQARALLMQQQRRASA